MGQKILRKNAHLYTICQNMKIAVGLDKDYRFTS